MRSLLVLMLAGCWSTHTPIMKQARDLESAGQLAEAEQAWGRAMRDEVTLSEWRRSRDHLCAVMLERMTPEVAALRADAFTYDQAAALHRQLRQCPETAPLDAEVIALEEQLAERSLAEADRLEQAGDRYAAILAAHPHMVHLRAEHPRWAWFEGLLEARRAEIQARLDATPAGAPVTRAALAEVLRRSGGAVQAPTPAEAAAPALAVKLAGATVTADPACAALALPETLDGAGEGYRFTLHVSGCTDSTSVSQETIPYTETLYRTEVQAVTRSQTTRTTTITPTYNVNCYTSINAGGQVCTTVGYYNDIDVEEVTETWEEEVEVQVPYEVERTRQGLFGVRAVGARLAVETTSADGARSSSGAVSQRGRGPEQSEGTSRDAVLATAPASAGLQKAAREQALSDARDLAAKAAAALRLDALVRAGADRSDPVAAREALLAAWTAGHRLSATEAAFVAEALIVPPDALADWEALPRLDAVAPASVEAELPVFQLPKVNNTVSKGYPPVLATIGFAHHTGAELAGQPTRTAAGLYLGGAYNIGWVTGGNRGFGVHLSPSFALIYQKRTSEDYVFPPNAEGFPNEEEQTNAAGYHLNLGAMVGYRARRAGLFVGASPQLTGHLIGFYNARSVLIPPTARLELRVIERYPILIDGWWGDVRTLSQGLDAPGARGAQIWFPLVQYGYLYGRVDTSDLRTQFKGLASYDDIDAGQQPLRSVVIGLSTGF
ncbi:MAG: hypothetical protein H6739_14285 [Alphaproteobacteria bacterium]|nr:hypothetical protein [Alphaproteobacteria bacterium]